MSRLTGSSSGSVAVLDAQQPHRADGPPQQPAQDVAARLVAGRHAVRDQHHAAADVVGDHPEADVVLVALAAPRAVLLAGQLRGALDDGEDLVDLVDVVLALQQVGDPLQAHAGVDVLARERPADVEVLLAADGAELLLHEHEVPELEVAVARVPVPVGAELGPAVDQDLAARAARSGHAHAPVVVLLAEPDDPVVGKARDLLPEVHGLVVVLVDAGVELRLVDPVAAVGVRAGDQLPRELDGAFLEVVAEREVAVHLEERAVPGGLADLLDVEGPHALLHRDRPLVRRRLLPEEVGLERHHAGVHEQQVRVVEQQRCRRHHLVASRLEVRDEPSADLRGVHQSLPFLWSSLVSAPSGPRGQLVGGRSMEREAEAVPQLDFLLGHPRPDLVTEETGSRRTAPRAGRRGPRG